MNHFAVLTHILSNSTIDRFPVQNGQADWQITPGVFRTWTEMEALENELFPHVRFEDYGEDGMKHPDYKAAYEAAKAHAQTMLTNS